jgi:hypothetical protein
MHLIAELLELLRDQLGSPLLVEPEFGVGMDIAPPTRQIIVKFRDPLYDLHCRSPRAVCRRAVSSSARPSATSVRPPEVRHTISLRDASRAFSRCIRQFEGGAELRDGKPTSKAGKKAYGEERVTKVLCKIP